MCAAGYGCYNPFPAAPTIGARPSTSSWENLRLGSVIKKRRKKMRKHKHKKMLKKTKWARRSK
jgi:hypothetical protein